MASKLWADLVFGMTAILAHAQQGSDSVPAAQPQAFNGRDPTCINLDANTLDIAVRFPRRNKNCIRFTGGFSGMSGSFARLSYLTGNLLHLGETLSVGAEVGVRLRKVQAGFAKNSLFGKPVESGFTVYGQRFNYNQARESSIFAFQRDIPLLSTYPPDDLLQYVLHSYGGTVFVGYRLRGSSRVGLSYGYDVSDVKGLTGSTTDYFGALRTPNPFGGNFVVGFPLSDDFRTSKVSPSFSYSVVDNAIRPSRGAAISFSIAIAGAGGNVRTLEPVMDAKYFHSGFKSGHVIGLHLHGSMIAGYGERIAPRFNLYYMGGEDEIRGFDSWSIGPIGYQPGIGAINVFNNDGSPRRQKVIDPNGNITIVNVQQAVPIYRIVSLGGDTKVVTNIEYRVPIFGPLTLAFFGDAGIDKLALSRQLRSTPGRIEQLFPEAQFSGRYLIALGTQKIRTSTGVELQVLTPFNAPLRFYCAYNLMAFRGYLQPPIVVDRTYFPNEPTYQGALDALETPVPLRERRFMFRFSIGRTF